MPDVTCKLSGLEKSFGRNHVLRGIDLELRAGEVTALMGANGAGKSTLVKVLCGYHFADAGEIELAGAPFKPLDAADAGGELRGLARYPQKKKREHIREETVKREEN